jgi:chromate transporter
MPGQDKERGCGANETGAEQKPVTALTVFTVFLRLGLTSFGGPIAHLAYFREALVIRRRWIAEETYADLVALCQFLPGPASSQVGLAIGLTKAGLPGALAAWLGFTLPSALLMAAFGYAVRSDHPLLSGPLLHGLTLIAVAVVAQAVWGMARSLTPDAPRAAFAVIAALIVLIFPLPAVQIAVIAAAGLAGLVLLKADAQQARRDVGQPVTNGVALAALALFFILLFGLPVLAEAFPVREVAMIEGF